jgi:RimJ/RimL family protein N-acetyltransferase
MIGWVHPPGWLGLEVGWMLARSAWGQGYASEAGAAAIDWAWTTLDTARLISIIQPGNARSIRVAERLGMEKSDEMTLKGQPVLIFAIDRP